MSEHFGVNPQCMVIYMKVIGIYAFKGFSAIGRFQNWYAINVNFIGITGVNVNFSGVISVGIIHVIQKTVVGFLPTVSAIGTFVNLSANYGRIEQLAVCIFQIF